MCRLRTQKESMPSDKSPEQLLQNLRDKGYIESQSVMDSLYMVPREIFVSEEQSNQAYIDRPLSIGEGQTISAPHMVAIMTELLELEKGLKVLEVGTGSGYHAAVVAEIVGADSVYSVERHESLAWMAQQNLEEAGYGDVEVVVGDGSTGLSEHAPFDRIYLTCAAPDVPESIKDQLVPGGRMVLPVGRAGQELVSIDKTEDGFRRKEHLAVRFVQLMGEDGF